VAHQQIPQCAIKRLGIGGERVAFGQIRRRSYRLLIPLGILATEILRDLPAKVLKPFGVIVIHPGDVLELAYAIRAKSDRAD